MGVRGLQTFLKNNSGYASKNLLLNNTNLVIDSANLCCFLFAAICLEPNSPSERSDIYGGDLVAYELLVRQLFENLKRCNITPIFVIDGSVIGKKSTSKELLLKENTVYKRGYERFMATKTTCEESPDEKLTMSKLPSYIFKNITHEFGFQRVQCPYDADTHIARIANDLKCPALTNDSDFIIYSMPAGFIMLDSFEFRKVVKVNADTHGIRCNVFSQSHLSKFMPRLNLRTMPLLSVLLGNDYVEAGTFDRVLDLICGRYYNGPLSAQTFSHRRIANLLTWMQGKTLEEAIEFVLSHMIPSRRDALRKNFLLLLRNYKIESTDKFEDEINEVYAPFRPNTSCQQPAVLLKILFEHYNLSTIALDMIFHNTYYNYPVIDDHDLPSSNYVAFRPFSMAIALLRPRPYSGMTINQRKTELERDSFIIFDRHNGDYIKMAIRPLETLENFGPLEHMSIFTLMSLNEASRKGIMMSVFRFNIDEYNLICDTISNIFVGSFVHQISLCLLLIKYIGLETKQSPKPQFVNAILLTSFYYAASCKKLNESISNTSKHQNLLDYLKHHSSVNNGKMYKTSEQLYRRIVHFINQLQAAYLGYTLLNDLLEHTFQAPKLGAFFNGTLIFRLTKLMRLGELKIESICTNLPALLDTCSTIRLLVHCGE